MMSANRRHFLKTAGVSLSTLTLGSATTGAASTQRFIVDKQDLQDVQSVEVIHDLDSVDLLVVRTDEDTLTNANATYAPDGRYSPRIPYSSSGRSPRVEYPPEGETLYEYQWDKQDQRIPEVHETTRGEGTRVAIIDSGIGAGHPDLQHAVNADLS